ncbi:conserved hypothetical protein [Burkholderia gladioli]|uniref:HamA C-terminal domain-containing protein n=1 Tax=Burkholderia gladioli TaxID=28095 RepID=UPI001CAD0451|nr:DUF1837 domain-containing protein [Burkholderia gladioli]CAG9227862.1 conserved hypothetical protein [Burkholderia gladioli]
MEFEVFIDDFFDKVSPSSIAGFTKNKSIISLANDFEDGKWRAKKFNNFIWDNIKETALSVQERNCLVGKESSLLEAAARNLRLTDKDDDIGQGSELAEILLYGIMRARYGALPVVPKIFYKQNVNDPAKGADSVHIVLDEGGDFSLWLGEAKFYTSIENARLASIVESVKNSLNSDKLKKENSIITNVSDIEFLGIDDEVKGKIKKCLNQRESLDSIKPRLNIPILLLHECKITQAVSELTEDYKDEIKKYHLSRAVAYFSRQLSELSGVFKYEEIKFHLILFPVPHKSPIVKAFVEKAHQLRD